MTTHGQQRSQKLRRLADYHKSAADSFATAAERVEAGEHSDLFREYQKQHAGFAEELDAHATTLEGAPEEIDEIELSQLYTGLGRLESTVSESNLDAMIAETKVVEDELLEQYQDAMDAEWSTELRERIANQFAALQRSRTELHERY